MNMTVARIGSAMQLSAMVSSVASGWNMPQAGTQRTRN